MTLKQKKHNKRQNEMLVYGNKWSITKGMPVGELREQRAQKNRGSDPFPDLPGSCPVCSVKPAARPHPHKKWHGVCSRTKNLNLVKVVERPSTTCWDLQGESCHQACSQMKKSRESHEYCHGYFCLGTSPLELILEELWQYNFPGRKGIAFPIKKLFHKWSSV